MHMVFFLVRKCVLGSPADFRGIQRGGERDAGHAAPESLALEITSHPAKP